mmetsp:Transcript_6074/g.9343  ORF Transcript_6074/g.9343 Transcript_6074/m.9343 type:complete len:94 (-) Transcript_6074:507-788(-)
MKCGICQEKRMPARIHPSGDEIFPVAPAQPIRGGMAPTTAPTHVFATDRNFIGVYEHVYRTCDEAASKAASGFTKVASNTTLDTPVTPANQSA